MKTLLKINNDLKKYLLEEIDRTEDESSKYVCSVLGRDPFNWQWRFKFENNYGASVVKHYGSFGFDEDLFELGVIEFDDQGNRLGLTYDTSIGEDVIGYLSNAEVMSYLYKIKNLQKKEGEENYANS